MCWKQSFLTRGTCKTDEGIKEGRITTSTGVHQWSWKGNASPPLSLLSKKSTFSKRPSVTNITNGTLHRTCIKMSRCCKICSPAPHSLNGPHSGTKIRRIPRSPPGRTRRRKLSVKLSFRPTSLSACSLPQEPRTQTQTGLQLCRPTLTTLKRDRQKWRERKKEKERESM